MHRHSDHELLWAIDGVLEVRTPETVYTVPSGVSLWIPSFVPHEVTARSGTELSCTWLVASDVTGLDRVVALSTPPLLEQVLDHLTRDDLTDAARRRAEAFCHRPRRTCSATDFRCTAADDAVASADRRPVGCQPGRHPIGRGVGRRRKSQHEDSHTKVSGRDRIDLLGMAYAIAGSSRDATSGTRSKHLVCGAEDGFSFRKRVRCGFSSNDGRDTGGVCKPDRSSARANDRLATGLVRTATLSASIGLVPCRRMNLGLAKQSPCRSSACAQFDHFLSVPESSQRRRLPS